MKNQIYKDKNKRNLSFHIENKIFVLKSIYKNTSVPKPVRWNSSLKFSEFLKNNYSTSFVNRCVITGRKKKVNKNFRLSRLSFLKFSRNGFISGLTKSTW
jgi:ribosomal protein S14